jgi:myosin protein heavy chain
LFDGKLVLKQLQSNNIVEAIQFFAKGYPYKFTYAQFKYEYGLLCPKAANLDKKNAASAILTEICSEPDYYKLGASKVFLKSILYTRIDELKRAVFGKIIAMLQANLRAYLIRKIIKKMLIKQRAVSALQRNAKCYLSFKNWQWWTLYTKIKPLLSAARQEVN